jgi:hypothetical protein
MPETARQMLTPGLNGWGLGPSLDAQRLRFGHGGANEGFRCVLVVFFDGRGAAIMTNSDRGAALASEILGTLAVAYDWPDYRPTEKAVAAVDPSGYPALAGTYRVEARGLEAVVSVEEGRLYVSGTGIGRAELLPESETVFFSREDGSRFTFLRENGRVVAFTAMGLRAEKTK